jgi:hypothetical protein
MNTYSVIHIGIKKMYACQILYPLLSDVCLAINLSLKKLLVSSSLMLNMAYASLRVFFHTGPELVV